MRFDSSGWCIVLERLDFMRCAEDERQRRNYTPEIAERVNISIRERRAGKGSG
jgi:hypothetical protein